MSDDKKIIFSMSGVSKTFQGANTPIIKNIYLSFFYGAKIGILGLNGSGKSTLLKIIAGVDKNYQGDVVFAPGYTVGLLEQEPILDDDKTVLEVVKEGVAETVAILDEYTNRDHGSSARLSSRENGLPYPLIIKHPSGCFFIIKKRYLLSTN